MPHAGERPAKNPYRPGVGLQPTHLAGRETQIRRFRSTLSSAPEIPANLRLTGLRGVGKTVLLRRFEQSASEDGWATVMLELEPRHNSDERLTSLLAGHLERLTTEVSKARRLREAVSDAVEVARRTVSVSFEGFEWSLGGDLATRTTALAESVVDAVNAATRAGREGLVLLFDEAQILYDEKARDGDHPLSMLLAAVSMLQRQEVPVALVLCGLPTLTINLLEARTYSERMFRGDEVGSLPTAEARQAFLVPLEGTGRSASEELVERVLTTVEGYPYFIQLWGAELWDAATYACSDTLTVRILEEIESDIYRRLDLDFYAPRVDALTPAEQDLLGDAAGCSYPPLLAGELGGRSPKSTGNVNVLLGRLVKANVVYRQGKGRYFYTAPGFDAYLSRRAERLP
ncbi:ATP-binding protein [Cellulomonas fimi]|uniref:ATP-binding protein n=1 Tax=Cellulomonas fimi TaxID=1708 RepID=A0A7Y0LX84_CELFI|nr:ATP-binding protein [Cellulomonas fimi]NMR19735.1 ATP-binding protein [Cellulomonas fimi]